MEVRYTSPKFTCVSLLFLKFVTLSLSLCVNVGLYDNDRNKIHTLKFNCVIS